MKTIYPVIYHAKLYSENFINEETQGVLFAENFAEAAKIVEDYYGDILVSVKVALLEDSPVLELPNEVIQKLEEDNNL